MRDGTTQIEARLTAALREADMLDARLARSWSDEDTTDLDARAAELDDEIVRLEAERRFAAACEALGPARAEGGEAEIEATGEWAEAWEQLEAAA